MQIEALFDPRTWTLTYVVWDPDTRDAVVIDPVLDFDNASGKVWTESVDQVDALLAEKNLNLRAVMETHAHADHITGAQELKRRHGVPVVIGEHIRKVQQTFKPVFDMPADFATDGSQFDRLLSDGEVYRAGSIEVKTIHTPGHTPACTTYQVRDALFVGDALFMPDYGVGRCDFPAGDAEALYHSVHDRLYALPPETRVFVGHDYQPGGRELRYETTIGESREQNVQLRANTPKDVFVTFRRQRDATLSAPRLLYPSVQVNIDAGHLPEPADNGRRYLKVPLTVKEAE